MPEKRLDPQLPHDRLAKWAGIFLLTTVPLAYAHDGHDIVLYLKLLFAQIGTLIMAVAWCIGSMRNKIHHRRYPLDLAILLFLLINIISWITMAINPFKSGLEVAKIFTFTTLYFAVSRTFQVSFLKPWIYTITLVSAIISCIGICQYLGLGFYWLRSVGGGYPSSTFVLRNLAATYLIAVIPISILPFFFSSKLQSEIIWGSLSTLPIIFLIYTRTRGAWVGLGMAVFIFACFFLLATRRADRRLFHNLDKRKRIVAIFCLLFTFFMGSLKPQAVQNTTTGFEIPEHKADVTHVALSIAQGQHERFVLWNHTLKMIRDHWLIGAGIGNWELLYPKYAHGESISPGISVRRPHNDPMWILAETGLLGFATFLVFWGLTFFYLFRLWQKPSSKLPKFTILCIGVSLLAISGHACFSFPKERIAPLMFWSLLPGIISSMCAYRLRTVPHRDLTRPVLTFAPLLLSFYITYQAIKVDQIHYRLSHHRLNSNWNAVLTASDQALDYGVFNHWFLFWKAHVYYSRGDVDRALELLHRSLRYHPNEMTAHWKIGVIERDRGNLHQAVEALKKTIALDRDNPNVYHDLGTVYRLLGNLDAALKCYASAQSLKSEDPLLYLNIGGIYQEQNQMEKAIEAYSNFLTRSTDPDMTAHIQNIIEEIRKTFPTH